MRNTLTGKIARISVDHARKRVSFTLEGDTARYLLEIRGYEYMEKDQSQAFDLTQPGDEVAVSYYSRSSCGESDGDVATWNNQTLGLQGGFPDML